MGKWPLDAGHGRLLVALVNGSGKSLARMTRKNRWG